MAKCKKCDSDIDWKQVNGKWLCHNAGTTRDHWDLCSKLTFDKMKSSGVFFKEGNKEGYILPNGHKYVTRQSVTIRGKDYKPSGDCAGCCAPWEVCSWPCPDEIRN